MTPFRDAICAVVQFQNLDSKAPTLAEEVTSREPNWGGWISLDEDVEFDASV